MILSLHLRVWRSKAAKECSAKAGKCKDRRGVMQRPQKGENAKTADVTIDDGRSRESIKEVAGEGQWTRKGWK